MTNGFSNTPSPPYYAVIFTSRATEDNAGYAAMATAMVKLAETQPGYLGIESTSNGELGITVSYWKDENSILAWKTEIKHKLAQKNGIERWYEHYEVRVAKVERAYTGPQGRPVG